MGVASGSGWNLWVWLLGVVVRRYIIAAKEGRASGVRLVVRLPEVGVVYRP